MYLSPLYYAITATGTCYIDDVLMVWIGAVEETEEFMMELNGNDRNICLTYNFHHSKISFLDLSISIDQGCLSMCTFKKETACNTLLNATSHHPESLMSGTGAD